MTAQIFQFSGSTLSEVVAHGDSLELLFSPGIIVRSEGIPLSDASTLWTQDCRVRVHDAERDGDAPTLPAPLQGGSLRARGYKTIDMIQLPLDDHGLVEVMLAFADGGSLLITGVGSAVETLGDAKYVRHLDA